MNKELVFICHKCGHNLYVSRWNQEKQMKAIMEIDCPSCGEEAHENWILSHFGNYDQECGEE